MNYYSHLTEEDLANEVWKPVFGYEGLYEVSNIGRVKSLNYKHTNKEKILKPEKTKNGYLQVVLCKDGKVKHHSIHRLVGTAFIQRQSLFQTEINHKEEFAKWDNRASSLEWADRSYNLNYGTRTQRIAEANTNGKRSKPVIGVSITDGTTISFPSTMEAGRQGFNSGAVSACCRGKRNFYKGYYWKYA